MGKETTILSIDIDPKKNDLKWIDIYIHTNTIDPKANKKSVFTTFYISKSIIANE